MVHFPSGKNLEKEYFLDMGSDNESSDEPLSSQQYWTAESLVYRIENWDLHVACERLIENSKDRKLTSITPEIYTYICAKLYDTSVRLFATAMPVSHSWPCYWTINGTTLRTINRYQKVLFFQLSFSFRTFLFKMAYTTQFMDSWFGVEIYRVVLTV